jgi:hypothetical protein
MTKICKILRPGDSFVNANNGLVNARLFVVCARGNEPKHPLPADAQIIYRSQPGYDQPICAVTIGASAEIIPFAPPKPDAETIDALEHRILLTNT